jgi:hypothetical protein
MKENGTPVPRSRIEAPLMTIDADVVSFVRTQLQPFLRRADHRHR